MARVNYVKKARKAQGRCNKCGTEIKKGDAYKFIKPRYGAKKKACDKCRFRQSDTVSSDKLSRVYAAQENAEDAIGEWDGSEGSADDVKGALEEAASEIREVSEEYQASADSIRDTFTESETADECEEKANNLESWADEMESFEPDESFDEESAKSEAVEELRLEYLPSDEELAANGNPEPETPEYEALTEKLREEFEPDEAEVETKMSESRESWVQSVREQAESVLSECPL
jgi:hypothetical protein